MPIQMDGVTNTFHTTYFIDLINHGGLQLPYLDIPIPEQFFQPEVPYHLYVPGSQVATVSLVGTSGGNNVLGNERPTILFKHNTVYLNII